MFNKIWLLTPDEIDLLPDGTVLDTYYSRVLTVILGTLNPSVVTVGVDELDMTIFNGYTVYGFSTIDDPAHSDEIKRLISLFILGSK
jgi:hypothetical protein